MKLRITLLIPSLLVIITMASSLFTYFHTNNLYKKQIREETKEQLRLDITRLQNILYNLLTEDNLSDARLNISVMAMDSTINHLILTDENDKILIANRYSWEGDNASRFTGFNRNIAKQVRDHNQSHIAFRNDDTSLLNGFYPIILKIEDAEGQPIKRVGLLYTEISVARKLYEASAESLKQSVFQGSVMLTAALFIALLLHLLVSKRLATLTQSAARLAKGDLNSPITVGGNDELSNLANAFDGMRTHIKSQFYYLEHAESELRELNNTLEQRIDEATALLKDAQRIAHIGNWVWGVDSGELYWSDEIYRLIGYSPKEMKPDFELFMSLVHKEDSQTVTDAINRTLETGTPYSVDHRTIHADGSEHWLHEEGYLKQDDDGQNRQLIGTAQDITQHKDELEQREVLEKQLLHAQKMESLGQLTGGIAHDFNNILASILGFAQLARRLNVSKNDEKLSDYLSQILQSGERAASLVSQMLTFSRTKADVEHKQNLSAENLFSDTLSMLRPVIPSNIKLHTQILTEGLLVHANEVMMSQVLTNLCLNAKDAMLGEQGEIRLEVSAVHDLPNLCSSCHHPIKGDFVAIHVSDNGSGISEDVLNRIFDPFFSTKETGKGTGMGLPMVHGIIHQHGGHISIDSTHGSGTTISIYLPQVNAEAESYPSKVLEEPSNDIHENKHKHILVVDDEPALTGFLGELLELYGYQVTCMNESQTALEYFTEHKNVIDLVLTDQTMPNVLGTDMARAMMKLSPSLPVILCTGHSEFVNEQQALDIGIAAFMTKPLNSDKLLETIKQLLNS